MRVASVGPRNRINLTPMWFGWAGGRVYFYGRGQKVVNLRRDPACTVLVDRNEKFPELQAVMLQGRATVLETRPPKRPIRICRKRACRWAASTTAATVRPRSRIRRRTVRVPAGEIGAGSSLCPITSSRGTTSSWAGAADAGEGTRGRGRRDSRIFDSSRRTASACSTCRVTRAQDRRCSSGSTHPATTTTCTYLASTAAVV